MKVLNFKKNTVATIYLHINSTGLTFYHLNDWPKRPLTRIFLGMKTVVSSLRAIES